MNTETLIQILSGEPDDQREMSFKTRMLLSIVLGGSVSLLYVVFALGIQADLLAKMSTAAFWIKIGFALSLLVIGLIITTKVARPGKAKSSYSLWLAAPVISLWLICLWTVFYASDAPLWVMIEGSSWQVCSIRIACLSSPVFVATLWSLKHMAPTRPKFAGFTAGLFAGGLGACTYALFCGEYSPVFVGIWYSIGIFTPALVGAFVGKWILKW